MAKTNEYQGKSSDEIKSIRTYRNALKASQDYVRPQFEKAVRMYRLWAGVTPPEVQTTFSQVMLWFAYALVDQELTYAMRSMVTNNDWITLEALEPKYERSASMATKWLKYNLEKKQRFQWTAIPMIQSAYIFGNGYRWYNYVQNTKTHYVSQPNIGLMGMVDPARPTIQVEEKRTYGCISGTNLNYFNAFPSPAGCEINTPEELAEERLEYFIAQFYPTKKWLLSQLEGKDGWNKEQVMKMLDKSKYGSESENDPSYEFKNAILDEKGGWRSFSAPDWVSQIGREADHDDLNPRYRCGIMFEPDRWRIVGEDKFLLYDGEPMLNCTPVANCRCNQSQGDFFSTGIIEPVEDLIISMTMNFNLRLDHLIGKFHPTKYIPQRLIDDVGGDLSRFDTVPYNIIPYQHTHFRSGLAGMIYNESGEELGQQAFLEQGQMKEYLEDIISQKGTRGLSSATATGAAGMLTEDVARSMLRAMNVDYTGIQDCAKITLAMGAKYINEDEFVRTGQAGIPWESIEFEAINDNYGININGASALAKSEEMFKKQLSLAPLLLQDPQIAGQLEMKRQLLNAGQFKNVDQILGGDPGAPQSPGEMLMAQPKEMGGGMPGGVPSFQNDARSTMNRNTSDRSGAMVAAGAAGI